ncbi:hypothetical protein B5F37_09535 [Drancourtella sp. An210]|nr:hypothetical protein B5F37_09535 [Drancourtella sp. An210]
MHERIAWVCGQLANLQSGAIPWDLETFSNSLHCIFGSRNVGGGASCPKEREEGIDSFHTVSHSRLSGSDRMVRKKYQRGSFTVEAAILTSIILFILYGIILILFYYHDKNILTGAAYETAAVAARKNSMEPPFQEEDIEKLLKERISGKMIFFRGAEVQSECQNNYVWISVQASRNIMRIKAEVTSAVTEPQKKIRDIRKLEKIPQESDGK